MDSLEQSFRERENNKPDSWTTEKIIKWFDSHLESKTESILLRLIEMVEKERMGNFHAPNEGFWQDTHKLLWSLLWEHRLRNITFKDSPNSSMYCGKK